jgi:hypothetical protein
MMDNTDIFNLDLVEQHTHQTYYHQLDRYIQRYHASSSYEEGDEPLHPTGDRCEVVGDGEHHQPKEQLCLVAC